MVSVVDRDGAAAVAREVRQVAAVQTDSHEVSRPSSDAGDSGARHRERQGVFSRSPASQCTDLWQHRFEVP